MFPLWIHWVLSFITIFTPVWAAILWYIPIKSKWMYPLSAMGMYIPTVLWAFNPVKLKGVTQWMQWYGLFFIIFIAVFGMRFRWTDWNKAASLSLFALFIGGEWWEIPIFVWDYLAIIGVVENIWTGNILDLAWLFTHNRRLYTLAVCFLVGSIAKIKMTHMGWLFLAGGTIICFLLLLPCGLGILTGPIAFREMARITALCFTSIIILEDLDAS